MIALSQRSEELQQIIGVNYSEILARKHANDCRALMRSGLCRAVFPATRVSPLTLRPGRMR